MPRYRVYLISVENRVAGVRFVECHDDRGAIGAAAGFARAGLTVEVWRGTQLVASFRSLGAARTGSPQAGRLTSQPGSEKQNAIVNVR